MYEATRAGSAFPGQTVSQRVKRGGRSKPLAGADAGKACASGSIAHNLTSSTKLVNKGAV